MHRKHHTQKWNVSPKLLIISLCIFFFCIIFFEIKIKPIIWSTAEAVAQEMATTAISEATTQENLAPLLPENLVSIRRDKEGNVTLVQSNLAVMKAFAADVSLKIQDRMNSMGMSTINIPIGNLLGSPIFSQKGPRIKLLIMPAGAVNTDIDSEFIETGINQTTQKVYLKINAKIRIILPFIPTTTEVSSKIVIAETVIPGIVPSGFITQSRTY